MIKPKNKGKKLYNLNVLDVLKLIIFIKVWLSLKGRKYYVLIYFLYDSFSQQRVMLKSVSIFSFIAMFTELCLCRSAWLIIKYVLLLKIMRFWIDSSLRVQCVVGYGQIIIFVILVIKAAALFSLVEPIKTTKKHN